LNCARANEIAYLKFPVCGRSTQASIQAYTRTRDASVGSPQLLYFNTPEGGGQGLPQVIIEHK